MPTNLQVFIAIIAGILIAFMIKGILYGEFQHAWYKFRNSREEELRRRDKERRDAITYPKYIETDEHIRLYIQKNYTGPEVFEPFLTDLLREMSQVGWNTEIPTDIQMEPDFFWVAMVITDRTLEHALDNLTEKYEAIFLKEIQPQLVKAKEKTSLRGRCISLITPDDQ
jgi:hypothetical protein